MATEVQKAVKNMRISEDGTIDVEEVVRVVEDGVVVAETKPANYVLAPGETPDPQHPRLVKAANAFHDAETVARFNAKRAAAFENRPGAPDAPGANAPGQNP